MKAATKSKRKYAQEAYEHCSTVLREAVKAENADSRHKMKRKVGEALKKAMTCHFNHFADYFSQFLFQYYCNRQSYSAQVKKYQELGERYAYRNYIEKVVRCKAQVIRQLLNSKLEPTEIEIRELEKTCDEIEQYKSVGCPNINIFINELLLRKYELRGQYDKVIQICEQGIEETQYRGGARTYFNFLVQANIHQNKFDEAASAAKTAMEDLRKGDVWAYIMLSRITVELHREEYDTAYQLFREAIPEGYDRRVPELFQILKGYFSILDRVGKIHLDEKFRLGRLLNSVPNYTRDKAGQNMNILILQILYYLGKDNGRIIDKLDAIYQYNRLYGIGRAKEFVTALIKLVKSGFDPTKVQLQLSDRVNLDVEFIPYERLWGMACEVIKKENVKLL